MNEQAERQPYRIRETPFGDGVAEELRPRHWNCWSAVEHEAWLECREAEGDDTVAWQALTAHLTAETLKLALDFEVARNGAHDHTQKLILARLQRLIPQYADVLELTFEHAAGWELVERP